MNHLNHSITLYGFGYKYMRGEYNLEDVLKKAKALGADGFEIVAPQMVEGHPNPGEYWMDSFIDLYKKYELTPVCYSIYIDSGKHKGRFLNEAERLACTINEMEYARRMGFSVVRSQDALLPETMEKLLPYADELGLHLAIELHGPYAPSTPIFEAYAELFERKNSQNLGVVMDFSAFTSGPPATVLDVFPDDLCHKELLHKVRRLFTTTDLPVEELEQMLLSEGGDDVDVLIARNKIFTGLSQNKKTGTIYYRTHPDYEGFRRLLKWSKYMHGKFWHVDNNLACDEIDYPRFVKIMKEESYKGFIATEYEGSSFSHKYSDEDQIALHIQMLDKLWSES